jgi:uncharacterized RDD family membrane protein YckC
VEAVTSPARARRETRSSALVQTVDIETPELVTFSYTIAGVGSRVAAALIDYLLCLVLFIALLITLAFVGANRLVSFGGTSSEAWALAIVVLGQFFILWGYYVLWEGLADGQTPGKRYMRLRVVSDGGYSVSFAGSAIRNLVRILDMQPLFTYGVGIGSIVLTKQGKRLGDLAAGTLVVREQVVRESGIGNRESVERRGTTTPSRLMPLCDTLGSTTTSTQVLERFIERRESLDPARRAVLATRLVERFSSALSGHPAVAGGPSDQLFELYADERQARASGAVVGRETGAARERHAIVASGTPRWSSFAKQLDRAQRSGLKSLGEDGVRDFVAEYRDLAADLARLQTAARGREREEVFYLSRLMAGAHNLLYRGRSLTFKDVWRTFAVDAPREVRRSLGPIALAAGLLFGPAAIAYTAVGPGSRGGPRVHPHRHVGPRRGWREARENGARVHLRSRALSARHGHEHHRQQRAGDVRGVRDGDRVRDRHGDRAGDEWGEPRRSVRALRVEGNCVAAREVRRATRRPGAVGDLHRGRRGVSPGGRGYSFQETGRGARPCARMRGRAIRLVAASTVLLLIAGTLEGFVSPIETWPLAWKLAVSASTAVFLVIYLSGGRARVRHPQPAESSEPSDLLALGASGYNR